MWVCRKKWTISEQQRKFRVLKITLNSSTLAKNYWTNNKEKTKTLRIRINYVHLIRPITTRILMTKILFRISQKITQNSPISIPSLMKIDNFSRIETEETQAIDQTEAEERIYFNTLWDKSGRSLVWRKNSKIRSVLWEPQWKVMN